LTLEYQNNAYVSSLERKENGDKIIDLTLEEELQLATRTIVEHIQVNRVVM